MDNIINTTSPTLATMTDKDLNLDLLLEEFRMAGTQGDYWNRQRIADDTRLAQWPSQSEDGKKWDNQQTDGEPAFPWDGASDVRCYQSDQVVNELVAAKVASFWRADVRVEGVEPNDLAMGGATSTFLDWLRNNKLRDALEDDVELSAQFDEWYGWCALHVTWERQVSYRFQTISMETLVALADQLSAPGAIEQLPPEIAGIADSLAAFPDLVRTDEKSAIEVAKFLYRVSVNQNLPKNVLETEIPEMSTRKARDMVRDLREKGEADVPFPHLSRNEPCISPLKPWRDVLFPTDTTHVQDSRAVFIRQFMSESELRSLVLSDGWDKEFVEQAINTRGRMSTWNFSNQGLLNPLWQWSFTSQRNNLIEIIMSYHKAVDDDGITSVYYTFFSAHVGQEGRGTDGSKTSKPPLVGKSGLLNHPKTDQYPLIIVRREMLDSHIVSSRGGPEILQTSQREEKVLRDAMMDYLSIATLPPLHVYKGTMGQRYRFAPAAENLVVPGREPKLLEIAGQGPAFTIDYIQRIKGDVKRYFGLIDEEIPPHLSQMMLEPKVRRFLAAWSKAFKMAFEMYLRWSPETYERVTNQPTPGMEATDLDFIFHFDVQQLNPDMMEKKLNAFSQMLPEDTTGTINRSALVRAKARMVDPALAKELVSSEDAATQQLFDKVQMDLVKMSDGNEVVYTDTTNDPTAGTRMQIMTQIIQNNLSYMSRLAPEILQMLEIQAPPGGQPDQMFSGLVQKYLENLQQGISQQENKQIGRIGTRPQSQIGMRQPQPATQ